MVVGAASMEIRCRECGKVFRMISHTHLKKEHNMSLREYRDKYPNDPLFAEEIEESRGLILEALGWDK